MFSNYLTAYFDMFSGASSPRICLFSQSAAKIVSANFIATVHIFQVHSKSMQCFIFKQTHQAWLIHRPGQKVDFSGSEHLSLLMAQCNTVYSSLCAGQEVCGSMQDQMQSAESLTGCLACSRHCIKVPDQHDLLSCS